MYCSFSIKSFSKLLLCLLSLLQFVSDGAEYVHFFSFSCKNIADSREVLLHHKHRKDHSDCPGLRSLTDKRKRDEA